MEAGKDSLEKRVEHLDSTLSNMKLERDNLEKRLDVALSRVEVERDTLQKRLELLDAAISKLQQKCNEEKVFN
jgi:predicted RNase H-like nuclease (RuvC/YqgF family)